MIRGRLTCWEEDVKEAVLDHDGRDWDRLPALPRLHDRRVPALEALIKLAEVTEQDPMFRELVPQHLEERHRPRRDPLGFCQVWAER